LLFFSSSSSAYLWYSSFSSWSPSTVVSGQNENAGHFSHPTAMAMGQIAMWFTSFNDELERTPVKIIIQEMKCD
jgi:hypothetical protein